MCKTFPWERLTFDANSKDLNHMLGHFEGEVRGAWVFLSFIMSLESRFIEKKGRIWLERLYDLDVASRIDKENPVVGNANQENMVLEDVTIENKEKEQKKEKEIETQTEKEKEKEPEKEKEIESEEIRKELEIGKELLDKYLKKYTRKRVKEEGVSSKDEPRT
ncbi:unnamed protein product [Cochlearia groenlandica]